MTKTIISPRAKFGLEATDKLTGFKGIVSAYSAHLTGCDQWFLQPQGKKETKPDGHWFDENRLIFGKRKLDDLDVPREGKTSPDNGAVCVPPIK